MATGGRFWRRGSMQCWFVDSIASIATPQDTEITAGEDLTPDLYTIEGFGFENQPIDTPDMSSTSKKQIPGEDDMQPGTITIYEERTTNPLSAVLVKGTQGFIVVCPFSGDDPVATDIVEVWPVEVASSQRGGYGTDAQAATRQYKFTVTDAPELDAVVA